MLVKDIAKVIVGHQPRLGIAGKDEADDIVQGIVLMRRGEQSTPTIKRVEQEVERINAGNILPPGVRIERIYDRKDLIDITTRTVLHNMVFGIALIFLLQWVFLGNLRSAIIVGATIPFALFFAVGIMVLRGEFRKSPVGRRDRFRPDRRCHRDHGRKHLPAPGTRRASGDGIAGGEQPHLGCAASCARSSRRPRRQPIDLLRSRHHHRGVHSAVHAERCRGPHLRPDGEDLCLRAGGRPDRDLHGHAGAQRRAAARARAGDRDLGGALAPSPLCAGAALAIANKFWSSEVVALLALAAVTVRSLGLEFLPKLEEGNLWIRATMPSTISLEEGNGYVNRMRAVIRSFPEVESVVSQQGRPDDGTDAAGFFNAEFFAPLKPRAMAPGS